MINRKKISAEWLNEVSKQNKNADKILIEKVIRALLLVEGLAKENLQFVFKGGTALMLHLNSTKRFSIDIDIIVPKGHGELNSILDEVAQKQGFLRKEQQHRDAKSKIVIEHYKFFYSPSYRTNKEEEYVILDILFEKINYEKLEKLPVLSSFVPMEGTPILVEVPCMEDLLADKLTAFAPNTTGIPYVKNEYSMSMEILKQLYDIGNLFDSVGDVSIIKSTFSRLAATEILYRDKNKLNEIDVLDDIYQTSLCIASRGASGEGDFSQLQSGIQRLRSFIFSERYQIEKAIIHASKAAYLTAVIRYDANKIERFKDPKQIKDWVIADPMSSKLNKLKKSNPEAFYYWYKIFELIRSH